MLLNCKEQSRRKVKEMRNILYQRLARVKVLDRPSVEAEITAGAIIGVFL
jgi:hypothetical protein